MKFSITVLSGGYSWVEYYDIPEIATEGAAREWAEGTIERFNSSLRPCEKPRRLIGVEWPGTESSAHTWEKASLVTEKAGAGCYDAMRCRVCGITGKRWGLDQSVVLDPPYRRAKKWRDCRKARAHMKKRVT